MCSLDYRICVRKKKSSPPIITEIFYDGEIFHVRIYIKQNENKFTSSSAFFFSFFAQKKKFRIPRKKENIVGSRSTTLRQKSRVGYRMVPVSAEASTEVVYY